MARRQYLLALAAVAVIAVALLLWTKPEWLGGKAKPDFSAFLRVEEPREALMMGNFRSYDSKQQVLQQLAAGKLQWTMKSMHVEGSSDFPPYKIDTLTVPGYSHLDHAGTLTLEIFNDRLSSAVFMPNEPRPYSKRLREAGVSWQRQSLSVWQQQIGNLRISTNHIYATSDVGKTLNTVPFFSWEDVRLTAQSRQWYNDYGSKTMVAPIHTESSDSTR